MSPIRKTIAMLAVAVLAFGASACEDDTSGSGGSDTETTEAADTEGADETEGSDDGTEEESEDSAGEEPTGTDMEADFELFQGWVEDYAEEKDLPTPDGWNYLAEGETMDTGCTDHQGNPAEADDTAYFYCGPDKAMYVGEATMQLFADEFGAIAPGIGIAHEWGHHLQREAEIPITSQKEYINFENQADCIAGAWYGDLSVSDRGVKPMEFIEIAKLMVAISELEGPDRTHGTVAERTTSVGRGGLQGLDECETYFPDYPLGD